MAGRLNIRETNIELTHHLKKELNTVRVFVKFIQGKAKQKFAMLDEENLINEEKKQPTMLSTRNHFNMA